MWKYDYDMIYCIAENFRGRKVLWIVKYGFRGENFRELLTKDTTSPIFFPEKPQNREVFFLESFPLYSVA